MTSPIYRRLHRFGKWLLLFLIPVLLFGFLLGLERMRGARQLQQVMAGIQRSGGILDPLALAPTYPDGEAASLEDWMPIRKAVSALPSPRLKDAPWDFPRPIVPGAGEAALPAWQLDVLEVGKKSFTWQDLEAVSAGLGELWKDLDRVLAKPHLDLGLDWSSYTAAREGFLASDPSSWIKPLAQWLTLDAQLHLRNGEPEAAQAHVLRLIQVSQQFQQQPMLLFQTMQGSVLRMAMNLTWALLAEPSWSAESLEVLEDRFLRLDPARGLKAAIEMERAWAMDMVREVASTRNFEGRGFFQAAMDVSTHSPKPAYPGLWANVWSDFDAARLLQITGKELQATDAVLQGWNLTGSQDLLRELHEVSQFSPSPGLEGWRHAVSRSHAFHLIHRTAALKTHLALTIQAIRLERYKAAKGAYPESLEVLDFWAQQASPRDPYGKGALGYLRREDGSYLLYSVGPDGKDQGGDPARLTRSESHSLPVWLQSPKIIFFLDGKDVVWPRVQRPAEALSAVASRNPEISGT